ncbi:hypothetical protein ACJRO7_026611 [Eucalyptus globulus]|uniref:Uncharacterized protein n=1 Tax=Eucalyptus globulus TaxID=34317 RepID=A0ABD3JR56_EUCGL
MPDHPPPRRDRERMASPSSSSGAAASPATEEELTLMVKWRSKKYTVQVCRINEFTDSNLHDDDRWRDTGRYKHPSMQIQSGKDKAKAYITDPQSRMTGSHGLFKHDETA